MVGELKAWLQSWSWEQEGVEIVKMLLSIVFLVVLAWVAHRLTRSILLRMVERIIQKTKAKWDDILVKNRFFRRMSHIAPVLVIAWLAPRIFAQHPAFVSSIQLAVKLYLIAVGLLVLDAFLNALVDICRPYDFSKRLPIRGFAQLVKIVVGFTSAIIVLSILIGESPTVLLGGLGAMTAVLLLIFKDSILGFVAGIQLSTNNMVVIGDWIEMPKYGADGDVIDITLTTVKVQNWDKTITTIPTYALISDSFKNWRGMSESGGRRIKRSVYIDMTSVKFCTAEMIERFRKIQYLSEYIENKKQELDEYNTARGVDDSVLVNGRRMTNLGIFRAYISAYLRNHPKVHQNMTFLVRHLEPTPQGLPIQIYVFSNDQIWANYEAIQADLFDHILAVIPEFDLRVFQYPAGADLRKGMGAD